MARTVEQIKKSAKDSVRKSNTAVDVEKGPIYDWVITPIAEVLPETEDAADRLAKVYSIDFAKVATNEEATAFVTNWGEEAGAGSAAGSIVYFMKYSRPSPDEVITVLQGTLVGNSDTSLQYRTTETKSITGANADSFYNAQRRAYEIGIRVVAVANGAGYELPSGRINRLITNVRGIDAVENRTRAEGGDEAESISSQIDRIREKFKGLAINTPDGGIHRIRRYDTAAITDVVPVTSSDREVFKRLSFVPATDYYVLGEVLKEANQVYTSASGGETEIPLEYVPCKSINSVLVNNVKITDFYLAQDTSLETGYSARSKDKLILGASLLAGDVVIINLTYNSLVGDLQTAVLSETKLFATDELAREFKKIPVVVSLTAKSLPNYEPTQVEADIQAELENILNVTTHTDSMLPGVVLEKLIERVAGIANPSFNKFKRSTKATAEVEMLVFDKNEVPVYDLFYVNINLRST